MEESLTIVVYDIEKDRIRNKIADICKDYGLVRIQFSAFQGPLSRNRREELFLKLTRRLGDAPGKILLIPICHKDVLSRMEKVVEKVEEGANGRPPMAPASA